MFIDEAKISIKAGDGGKGCISFRREKNLPRGGPHGGDGGRGGDVIFIADKGINTLLKFRYKRHFDGQNGGNGEGNDKRGKNGETMVIKVPCGTLIKLQESGETLCDLTEDGVEFIAATAGIGGKGNAFFKSSVRQAPKFAQPGMPGDGKEIKLELKLLADIGLVGLPNAGKSTLISRITAAHPKIADYPFTTLAPKIGVVQVGETLESFVIADMPGLIKGAHDGKGLGIRFLKHIERTAVICHLIDASNPDASEMKNSFEIIENELKSFSNELVEKRRIVVLTKIDAIGDRSELGEVEKEFKKDGHTVLAVSGVSGENIDTLVHAMHRELKKIRNPQPDEEWEEDE